MTLLVADIASYQQGLTLAQLRAAGVGAINVKVSHGLTGRSVHPQVARWVADARAAGMGVSTFHWLDGSAPGAAQAEYAYERVRALGGLAGMAHVVDVEADATEAHYAGYVTTMTRLLGRPIVTYSADWWWQPRGWAGRTPWLWAAPNAGYLPAYPGDSSTHWRAGYGGWADLAVMQYAVLPVAGIRVSMSAVRDIAVWEAMTGGTVTAAKPNHKAARALLLQHLDLHPGRTVNEDLDPLEAGIVGDTDHADGGDSYHLGADQIRARGDRNRYSVDESARDRRGLDNHASAMDIGFFRVTTPRGTFDLYDYNIWMIGLCRAGDPDTTDLREVIYSPDGRTVTRWDDLGIRSTGDTSHRTHTHHSEYRDADGHRMLRLATRWLQHIGKIPQEDDMPTIAEIRAAVRAELTAAVDDIAKGVWAADVIPVGQTTWAAGGTIGTMHDQLPARTRTLVAADINSVKTDLAKRLETIYLMLGATGDELRSFNAREGDEVPASAAETARAVLDALAASDTSPAQTAAALRAVLGDRAADVGRYLAGDQS